MAETIHSRQNTMFGSQGNRSITNFGIDQRSLSSIELSPSRDQRQISKINIEFGGKRTYSFNGHLFPNHDVLVRLQYVQ